MDEELKLLNMILENEKINQRAIAKEVGVSLGTINSMLRELEAKQYLLISRATHNSARYLLTEEGKAYRSRKLYQYIEECSECITKVRTGIRNSLLSLISQGVVRFYLSETEDEFYRIVMLILMELSRKSAIVYDIKIPENIPENSVILGWHQENPYHYHKQYFHLINHSTF